MVNAIADITRILFIMISSLLSKKLLYEYTLELLRLATREKR